VKYYPTDIYSDHGHARIHEGHDIDPDVLRADLDLEVGARQPCDLGVEEVWLRYHPRVKWCDRFDDLGCDMQGDWHQHWSPVRPDTAGCAFTPVRPVNEPAFAAS
jgi:hypothetical protein